MSQERTATDTNKSPEKISKNFKTRAYNEYVKNLLEDLPSGENPDVIYMFDLKKGTSNLDLSTATSGTPQGLENLRMYYNKQTDTTTVFVSSPSPEETKKMNAYFKKNGIHTHKGTIRNPEEQRKSLQQQKQKMVPAL